MKTLTSKLVHETESQRFYELSEKITKGFLRMLGEPIDIPLEMEKLKNTRIKEEYKEGFETDGAKIVCVSDAHTHLERLVFVGGSFGGTYSRLSLQIEGVHTMMIYGGDASSMKPDRVYLRELAKINGYQYIQNNKPEKQKK